MGNLAIWILLALMQLAIGVGLLSAFHAAGWAGETAAFTAASAAALVCILVLAIVGRSSDL
jgi:hypothetical protein